MAPPVFHITSMAEWSAARDAGVFRAASLGTEGFIHCSEGRQVERVANAFYRGMHDLVLLRIDPAKLTAELRYEQAVDVDDWYPHVYGGIDVAAVVGVEPLKPGPDGRFSVATRDPDGSG